MPLPYAFEVPGRASAIPIALWSYQYDPHPHHGRFQAQLSPIRGAFVACVRISEGLASLEAQPDDIRYGRTNDAGWVVKRELAALGEAEEIPACPYRVAPAPVFWMLTGENPARWERAEQRAEPSLMYGIPNEGYRIFWSYERSHFDDFVAALEQDVYAALDSFCARLYMMEPFGQPAQLKELDLLSKEEREVVARLMFPGARRGYHSGAYGKDVLTSAIFDATPTSLRALFLAEFVNWYAQTAAKRSGPDLAVLFRARGLIDAARQGSPEADFEASLWCNKADPANQAGQFLWCDGVESARREHRVFEKYRLYAWRCAVGGIQKESFIKSLPTSPVQIHGTERDWQSEANAIGRRTSETLGNVNAAVHPVFDRSIPRGDLLLGSLGLKATLAYFDLYSLGLEIDLGQEGTAPFDQALDSKRRAWDELPQEVEALCASLLEHAQYDRFAVDLAARCRDSKQRQKLFERYLDAVACADHPWWHVLETRGADPAFWRHLAPAIKALAESFKGTGKTLSSLVEARLAAHTLAFREAQALLETLWRHEIAWSGETVDPFVHFIERVSPDDSKARSFRVYIDIRDGRLTVAAEDPVDVGLNRKHSFQLLRVRSPAGPTPKPALPHAYALARDVSEQFSQTLTVPVDLAALKRRHTSLPTAFALCAEAINLAYAVGNVADALKRGAVGKEMLIPVWDVTKGVVSIADSYQAVLKALKPPIDPSTFLEPARGGVLKVATRVFGGLDGFVKIYKGTTILFSEDSDLAFELSQGHDGRAVAQRVKGALQIAVGVMGVLGSVPGVAALVATPVGLAVAIGGALVCAGIDLVLDATVGYEEHVMEFKKALFASKKREMNGDELRVVSTIQQLLQIADRTFKE